MKIQPVIHLSVDYQYYPISVCCISHYFPSHIRLILPPISVVATVVRSPLNCSLSACRGQVATSLASEVSSSEMDGICLCVCLCSFRHVHLEDLHKPYLADLTVVKYNKGKSLQR